MAKKKKKLAEVKNAPIIKLSTQERHKRIWDALFYSHQRLDTLLIAISGAGIYLILETIKYLKGKDLELHFLIYASAVILLVAIILNFFSQWAASKVHHNDYILSTIDFTCEEEGTDRNSYIQEIHNHECKISIYSKFDSILSATSIILMSLGLVGIVSYFIFIF